VTRHRHAREISGHDPELPRNCQIRAAQYGRSNQMLIARRVPRFEGTYSANAVRAHH
jgi:hypothetical protein